VAPGRTGVLLEPLKCLESDYEPFPPHTATCFPPRSPSHNKIEHVRSSRFFQSSELVNVSSSVLKSEKILREATRIIFRFARLNATVKRRGSSRNSLEASKYARSL
jgi:hypothetical protein